MQRYKQNINNVNIHKIITGVTIVLLPMLYRLDHCFTGLSAASFLLVFFSLALIPRIIFRENYSWRKNDTLVVADEFIREVYLQEELIHASQHLEFYGIEMDISRKNVEFEAKTVQDMLMWKHIGYGAEISSVGHDNEFMSDYSRLLGNYTIQGFHELCIRWKGYSGSYNPNFVPKVIQSYLKK